MNIQDKEAMKASFRRVFPEFSARFEAAKTQDEVLRIHDEFINVQKAKLATALQREIEPDETEFYIPISLTSEQFEKIQAAEGFEIEKQLQYLLDGLERVANLGDDADDEKVAAQLLAFGSTAITLISGDVVGELLNKAMKITTAVVTVATLGGVLATGGASIVIASAALAIALIVIPIIFFMLKPAICIMFLINQLDKNLVFKEDYNLHGKTTLITSEIGTSVEKDGLTFPNGGFYSTSKRKNALIGTQFGMTMNYGDVELNFGMGCPLAQGKNNCYVMINETAEAVAKKSNEAQKQFHFVKKDGVRLNIACSSASGSIVFFLARAY